MPRSRGAARSCATVLGRAGRGDLGPAQARPRRDVELGAQPASEVADDRRAIQRRVARSIDVTSAKLRSRSITARGLIGLHRIGQMVRYLARAAGDARPADREKTPMRSPDRRANDARASWYGSRRPTSRIRAPWTRRSASIACRIFCSLILPKPGSSQSAPERHTRGDGVGGLAGASAWKILRALVTRDLGQLGELDHHRRPAIAGAGRAPAPKPWRAQLATTRAIDAPTPAAPPSPGLVESAGAGRWRRGPPWPRDRRRTRDARSPSSS